MNAELRMKRLFRRRWEGWSETYEPTIGSGVGIPDLQVLVERVLLPVECKMAERGGDELFLSDVRPAQLRWHREFIKAGGISLFVAFVSEDEWYSVFAPLVVETRAAFPLKIDEKCVQRIWPAASLYDAVYRAMTGRVLDNSDVPRQRRKSHAR